MVAESKKASEMGGCWADSRDGWALLMVDQSEKLVQNLVVLMVDWWVDEKVAQLAY